MDNWKTGVIDFVLLNKQRFYTVEGTLKSGKNM